MKYVLAGMALGCALATLVAQAPATPKDRPNAQMKAVLDQLAALGGKPIEDLKPEEARKQPTPADAVKALLKKQGKSASPEAVGKVEDRKIPGAVGELPARVYTPKGEGPFPVVVYWHGGGWVIASIDVYDSSCRALCNAANAVVISCEYRRAPEHPFPAAPNDAVAAYEWVTKNAADLGGDPKKIAVVGESAGGNLAAVVARNARDKKLPMPVCQVLVYPVADLVGPPPPSNEIYADAKPLNAAMMKWFGGHYLKDKADAKSPDASPLRADDLSGLPPALIINAEIDPLRDHGKLYFEALGKADVKATRKVFPGVTHEFFGMGAVLDEAKTAVGLAAEFLKKAFAK